MQAEQPVGQVSVDTGGELPSPHCTCTAARGSSSGTEWGRGRANEGSADVYTWVTFASHLPATVSAGCGASGPMFLRRMRECELVGIVYFGCRMLIRFLGLPFFFSFLSFFFFFPFVFHHILFSGHSATSRPVGRRNPRAIVEPNSQPASQAWPGAGHA